MRDFGDAEPPVEDPVYRLDVPKTREFADWYQASRSHRLGRNAILHPNVHSPLWGDTAAAALVSHLLGEYQVKMETVPGSRIHPMVLREHNAVLIGRPEYSDAIARLMPDDGLAVEYCAAERKVGVHNRQPRPGEPEWRFASDGLKHNFGLVTVFPSDTGGRKRTIVFSGINSDGSEAGARYFASPESLRQLEPQFARAGSAPWPARYQVVIRTESIDTYSFQARFEYLRVQK